MVVGLLKKIPGYDEETIQSLFRAGENRLVDMKAFCHGGTLSTGQQVPGQAALYKALVAVVDEVGAQRQVIAQLVEKVASLQVVNLPPVASVDVARSGGKTSGKQQGKKVAK